MFWLFDSSSFHRPCCQGSVLMFSSKKAQTNPDGRRSAIAGERRRAFSRQIGRYFPRGGSEESGTELGEFILDPRLQVSMKHESHEKAAALQASRINESMHACSPSASHACNNEPRVHMGGRIQQTPGRKNHKPQCCSRQTSPSPARSSDVRTAGRF